MWLRRHTVSSLLLLAASSCVAQLPAFDAKSGSFAAEQSRCDSNKVKKLLRSGAAGQLEPAGCTELHLSHQNIGEEGAERLASLISARGAELKHLDVSANQIRDRGARALAALLGGEGALSKLKKLRADRCVHHTSHFLSPPPYFLLPLPIPASAPTAMRLCGRERPPSPRR